MSKNTYFQEPIFYRQPPKMYLGGPTVGIVCKIQSMIRKPAAAAEDHRRRRPWPLPSYYANNGSYPFLFPWCDIVPPLQTDWRKKHGDLSLWQLLLPSLCHDQLLKLMATRCHLINDNTANSLSIDSNTVNNRTIN